MRRRGALQFPQALDIAKEAERDGTQAPAERKFRLLDQLRQLGVNRPRIRGRLMRHPKPGLGCQADRPKHC